MGRLRIIRALAAGAASHPSSLAAIMLSIHLDATVAQSSNPIVPRGKRDFQISIGAHHAETPWASRVGAANSEGGADRVFPILANTGFGWRLTFEINGTYEVAGGSGGIYHRKQDVIQGRPVMGKRDACCKSRLVTKTGPGMANSGDSWRARNSASPTPCACRGSARGR